MFISSNDAHSRALHHENIVEAAVYAGVKHVIYTSITRKTEDGSSPVAMITMATIATEELLRNSGLRYTILKNPIYAEVIVPFIGPYAIQSGIYFPARAGKASFTLRDDLAEATANILLSESHENQTFSLANEENIGFADIAQILSEVSGEYVSYVSPEIEQYKKVLADAGTPLEYLDYFVSFGSAIANGEFETTKSELVKILDRPAISMKDYLQSVFRKH